MHEFYSHLFPWKFFISLKLLFPLLRIFLLHSDLHRYDRLDVRDFPRGR